MTYFRIFFNIHLNKIVFKKISIFNLKNVFKRFKEYFSKTTKKLRGWHVWNSL